MRRVALPALLFGALWAAPAMAGDGRVPHPDIPKAERQTEKGHAELMRANHMQLLLHQRDETMRKGIRTTRFSLKECISCHAVKGADAKPVSYKEPEHFCRVCHDYAAVRVDCFQCHASKPSPRADLKARSGRTLTAEIKEYLRR